MKDGSFVCWKSWRLVEDDMRQINHGQRLVFMDKKAIAVTNERISLDRLSAVVRKVVQWSYS